MRGSRSFSTLWFPSASIVGLALFVAASVQGHSLPPPINLSASVGGGQAPVLAIDARGNINIAWLQFANGVFFTRSVDGGATFPQTTAVQVGSQPLEGLQMALDAAGNINLLWTTSAGPENANVAVFFSRSNDAGLTFSTPKNLSANLAGIHSFSAQLAVERNGNVDIVWPDVAHTGLFFIRSTDGGADFSAPVKVWDQVGDVLSVRFVVGHQGQIYVFWSREIGPQCDILFSRSVDGGVTFSSALNVSNILGACSAEPTPLADSRGDLDLVWSARDTIFFIRSGDGGMTFSAPVRVSGGIQSFRASCPQIAVDHRGNIEVAWTAVLSASSVLFVHSEDNGDTFSVPEILNLPPRPNMTGAGEPKLGIDHRGDVTIGWSDDSNGTSSGDFHSVVKRSTDGGDDFSNPLDVSSATGEGGALAQMAVDRRGNAYLVSVGVGAHSDVLFEFVPAHLPRAGGFRLNISPQQLTVTPGETDQFQVTVDALRSDGETVDLSCSDLPAFATCTFDPPSLVTHNHSESVATMTLTIPATLFPGTYVFALNAVGGSTVDTQTVELIVQAPGVF